MYNISIHNTQHLCVVENVAKHSVRYTGVLHFDPASLKPLWSGMGEVVPASTSPTLHPPFPCTVL